MDSVIEKSRCTGCHACFNACPAGAIRMEEDKEGFLFPVIDAQACVDCGLCRMSCPVLHPPELLRGESTYACAAAERDLRLASSSGAVFTLLAEDTLRDGGVVCGAAFDGPERVRHVLVETPEQLSRIKGAKYVQSEIGDVFQRIDSALKSGRRVLFSGTGCQAAGLKSFLGCDPEELLTVDMICHGVPSPAVWRDYLKEMGKDSPVAAAEFRAKEPSGGRSCFRLRFVNGEELGHAYQDDLYVKGFLQNLYLRESCFSCPFKGTQRCSDMTIGDFWSVKEYHPALDDGYGVSAVLTHSEKGDRAFRRILTQLNWERARASEAACWNECLLRSVAPTDKRAVFYSRWRSEGLLDLLGDLTAEKDERSNNKTSIAKKALRKLKSLFS